MTTKETDVVLFPAVDHLTTADDDNFIAVGLPAIADCNPVISGCNLVAADDTPATADGILTIADDILTVAIVVPATTDDVIFFAGGFPTITVVVPEGVHQKKCVKQAISFALFKTPSPKKTK
ncbi:MAG: hypothetical protein HY958_13010 [Bacteroidia bacterium]|nr:hypothetical protein [Bacteroidia bacterium]